MGRERSSRREGPWVSLKGWCSGEGRLSEWKRRGFSEGRGAQEGTGAIPSFLCPSHPSGFLTSSGHILPSLLELPTSAGFADLIKVLGLSLQKDTPSHSLLNPALGISFPLPTSTAHQTCFQHQLEASFYSVFISLPSIHPSLSAETLPSPTWSPAGGDTKSLCLFPPYKLHSGCAQAQPWPAFLMTFHWSLPRPEPQCLPGLTGTLSPVLAASWEVQDAWLHSQQCGLEGLFCAGCLPPSGPSGSRPNSMHWRSGFSAH